MNSTLAQWTRIISKLLCIIHDSWPILGFVSLIKKLSKSSRLSQKWWVEIRNNTSSDVRICGNPLRIEDKALSHTCLIPEILKEFGKSLENRSSSNGAGGEVTFGSETAAGPSGAGTIAPKPWGTSSSSTMPPPHAADCCKGCLFSCVTCNRWGSPCEVSSEIVSSNPFATSKDTSFPSSPKLTSMQSASLISVPCARWVTNVTNMGFNSQEFIVNRKLLQMKKVWNSNTVAMVLVLLNKPNPSYPDLRDCKSHNQHTCEDWFVGLQDLSPMKVSTATRPAYEQAKWLLGRPDW